MTMNIMGIDLLDIMHPLDALSVRAVTLRTTAFMLASMRISGVNVSLYS